MAKIRKVEVAKRQLDAAVNMVLNGYDPIPVHTILHAALDVVRGIAKSQGKSLKTDQAFQDMIDPKHFKDAEGMLRRPGNFYKHADRDVDEQIDEFPSQFNDGILSIAILSYQEIAAATPIMESFMRWVGILYPGLQKEKPTDATLKELSRVLKNAPRDAQLICGRALLATALNDLRASNKELNQLELRHPAIFNAMTNPRKFCE